MSIVLDLVPFFVFFALMRLVSPVAGLVGALIASLLLCARTRRLGKVAKVLEVGGLMLFGLLVAYTMIAAPHWTVARVRLAVDGGLLAIALVSLAIDQPFTLQYARERVPEALWATPVFLRTNRIITAVWAGAFAVHVAADAAAEYAPAIPISIDVVASIAAFLAAVWFTRWYPARVQRRYLGAANAPA